MPEGLLSRSVRTDSYRARTCIRITHAIVATDDDRREVRADLLQLLEGDTEHGAEVCRRRADVDRAANRRRLQRDRARPLDRRRLRRQRKRVCLDEDVAGRTAPVQPVEDNRTVQVREAD